MGTAMSYSSLYGPPPVAPLYAGAVPVVAPPGPLPGAMMAMRPEMRGPEPGMMNPLERNPEGNAAANKSALLEHVSHTMQYDLNIASRESKLLQGEKRELVVAAEAANQHSEARIEMLEKERADAVTLVDRAQKKRDWAEHRLQQEEEETSNMHRKVA